MPFHLIPLTRIAAWLYVGSLLWSGTVAGTAPVRADETAVPGNDFFEKRVRPVLSEHCLDCHNEDQSEGDLRLDSLNGFLRGGKRGPALVPENADASLFIRAVRHGEVLKMPPKTKLPARQIADLIAWVKMGAPWPDSLPAPVVAPAANDVDRKLRLEELDFWSLQPIASPVAPDIGRDAWARLPLDAFILARLNEAGCHPAPRATRRTLIRRVTFDLTGLPPTPDEIDAFLQDEAPDAFARLVDRLLQSPRYGQRWGRHWLDVARYADSNGMDENLAYANAYRYRDYVVAALNRDKPFDQFVREQIAGDLLAVHLTGDASKDALAATGFLTLGAKMLAEDDPVKMQMDIIDEQIDTLGRAFMGLTLGCARCHDHKFDPLLTSDYYALAGIFKSTKTMENFSVVARWQERPLASAADIQRQQQQQQRAAATIAQIDTLVNSTTLEVVNDDRRQLGDYLLAAERQRKLDAATTRLAAIAASSETDEAVVVEAETVKRGNLVSLADGYGEGIGVIAGPGGPNHGELEFSISRAGSYAIAVRYAAAEARPTRLTVAGKSVNSAACGEVTGSWYPDTQRWSIEGQCSLPAGPCTIRFDRDGPIPHIDKLMFVAVSQLIDSSAGGLERQSGDFTPKSEFVVQWTRYLNGLAADSDSPLAVWNAFAAGLESPNWQAALNEISATPTQTFDLHELAGQFSKRAAGLLDQDAEQDNPLEEQLRAVLFDDAGPFKSSSSIETHFPDATRQELVALRAKKQEQEQAMLKLPTTMAVSDGTPEDIRIHFRGSHLTKGRVVARRFPVAFERHATTPISANGSGRLELARWMTRADHPLTARVIVNRVWQWHFGEGLVRSPDNLGRLGQTPTHPQLLDWLATRFVESGWSLKELHRLILLSATYQMSTQWNAHAAAIDPENRLLWRFNRRRLEAEAIRDAMLAISGRLDEQIGGSILPTENRKYVTNTANVDPVAYQTNRRSLYLPVVRSALYEVFQAFDFADPSVMSGRRQSTTVAPQALFIMNSKFVTEQTRALAEWLTADDGDDAGRVRVTYQRTLGRPPTTSEISRATSYVQAYTMRQAADIEPLEGRIRAWQSFCRVILATNEFIFLE
ncbi:MAG: DUF1553 domain-containing protein [Pirellulaceae bacterium]|nr:DUF1553 domain-containing protein [Pirellulaceae bacterium]